MRTGIPYLEADDTVRVGVDDALGHEAGANGGCCLGWVESAFAITHHQGRFAHALGAEDDDFGLEGRHVWEERAGQYQAGLRLRGVSLGASDGRGLEKGKMVDAKRVKRDVVRESSVPWSSHKHMMLKLLSVSWTRSGATPKIVKDN